MKDKSFAKKSTQNKSNETAIDQSIVVGLDIGTTKIACFVGVKNDHGKIEIISMGKSKSIGVKQGVVFNIGETIESIEKALHNSEYEKKRDDFIREFLFKADGHASERICDAILKLLNKK